MCMPAEGERSPIWIHYQTRKDIQGSTLFSCPFYWIGNERCTLCRIESFLNFVWFIQQSVLFGRFARLRDLGIKFPNPERSDYCLWYFIVTIPWNNSYAMVMSVAKLDCLRVFERDLHLLCTAFSGCISLHWSSKFRFYELRTSSSLEKKRPKCNSGRKSWNQFCHMSIKLSWQRRRRDKAFPSASTRVGPSSFDLKMCISHIFHHHSKSLELCPSLSERQKSESVKR